jgi:3-hydroxypropanoate dehydrogenase
MTQALPKQALDQLFTEARTHHAWTDRKVSDDLLRQVYELAKWGPTSVNALPMRILFVRTPEAKEKLYPALMGANVEQVKAAPVTAVIAFDENFYEKLPILFPAFDARPMFTSNRALSEATAFRNSSLQGAYFLLAARSLGLDTCPMSGFDNAKLNETFFKGTSWKSNFIATVGYGDYAKLFPRGPRISFEEACKFV